MKGQTVKLPTIYLVTAEYSTLGLALDQGFQDEKDAIDQCFRHHEYGEPYRVFKLEFLPDDNRLECATEITEDVQALAKAEYDG